jgi:hypothetical protein
MSNIEFVNCSFNDVAGDQYNHYGSPQNQYIINIYLLPADDSGRDRDLNRWYERGQQWALIFWIVVSSVCTAR